MDVDEIRKKEKEQESHANYPDQTSQSDRWGGDVDALGKGKSAGKGGFSPKGGPKGSVKGPCWLCGEQGHLSYECRY